MTSMRPMAAILGFLFVAAWIAFNFGYAILCLLGAAVFYYAVQALEGGVDLAELQSRFGRGEAQSGGGDAGRKFSAPATPRRRRVE